MWDKLKSLIQSYPYETTQRNPLIVEELAGLNQIWRKIDPSFAHEFYKTLFLFISSISPLGIAAISLLVYSELGFR